MSDDLVKRLRSVFYADSDLLEEAADRIKELEAERDLATSALMHLERCAQVVSERGAVTGPQWTRLTVAILRARSALNNLPNPAPINEPRLVQSAPLSQN
jgi:hypothetical protein